MIHHHMPHFSMPHFGMPEIRMPKFFGGSSSGSSNGVGNTSDKGTKEPQSTGIDKLYPDDCGRDDKNKGLLCFPDGELCKNRKQGKSLFHFAPNSLLMKYLNIPNKLS